MTRIRLLASFLALVATALLLFSLSSVASQSPELDAQFPLPQQVGSWVAVQDEEFEEDILSVIEPDAYAMRLYEEAPTTPRSASRPWAGRSCDRRLQSFLRRTVGSTRSSYGCSA
jgi:hypothetical protein